MRLSVFEFRSRSVLCHAGKVSRRVLSHAPNFLVSFLTSLNMYLINREGRKGPRTPVVRCKGKVHIAQDSSVFLGNVTSVPTSDKYGIFINQTGKKKVPNPWSFSASLCSSQWKTLKSGSVLKQEGTSIVEMENVGNRTE